MSRNTARRCGIRRKPWPTTSSRSGADPADSTARAGDYLAAAVQQLFLGATVSSDGSTKPFPSGYSAACMGTLTAANDPAIVIGPSGGFGESLILVPGLQVRFIPGLPADFAEEPASSSSLQAAIVIWAPWFPFWRLGHASGWSQWAKFVAHSSSIPPVGPWLGTTRVRASVQMPVRRNRHPDLT